MVVQYDLIPYEIDVKTVCMNVLFYCEGCMQQPESFEFKLETYKNWIINYIDNWNKVLHYHITENSFVKKSSRSLFLNQLK